MKTWIKVRIVLICLREVIVRTSSMIRRNRIMKSKLIRNTLRQTNHLSTTTKIHITNRVRQD
jgi:hypothetical protein